MFRQRGSLASTPATMRSQRAPANAKTSPVAMSTSRATDSRSSARARKRRVRTVAEGIDEAARGFLDAHLLDVAHHEHRAVVDRQLVDPALEDAAQLGAQRRRGRGLGLVVAHLVLRAVVRGLGLEGRDDAVTLAAPELHQRPVHDNPGQPGGDLRVAAEVVHVAVGVQIRVLQRVLGVGVVVEDGPSDAKQPSIVLAHQRLERLVVVLGLGHGHVH